MSIEILKDLQEGLVVLLYIVGLCVLGVALHELIIGKFCNGVPRKPRPSTKPRLGGYQPDDMLLPEVNGVPPIPKCKKPKNKREPIMGREFILFLKEHGYIDDSKIKSVTIHAPLDDATTIKVNKYMTKEGDKEKG